MRELEAKFFDEYKRLDALCRDMLGAERGVSEYIEQMEAAHAGGERLVPGWKDDYYALKHLRWLRNQIAHEAGATGCGAGELARLKELHGRAMKQQDPLALLYRAQHPPRRASAGQHGRREKSPLRVWLCAGVVLGLFVLLAVYLAMHPWMPS